MLGFSLLRLGRLVEAKSYLTSAKEFVDERNETHRKTFQALKPDAPVFVEQRLLAQALDELASQS
jgi:hypothetical protein